MLHNRGFTVICFTSTYTSLSSTSLFTLSWQNINLKSLIYIFAYVRIDFKTVFSLSPTMLRFESLGPTLIDCEGCSNYISVYVENPDDAKNNNNDVKDKKIKKMTIIDRYIPMAQKIKDMDVYDDDIWVMSFPKVRKLQI